MRRGAIRDWDRATQIKDFTGLQYGKVTPTDIDGSMDFGGRIFILLEAKHRDAPLPGGQRLHLEYQCRSHALAQHPALALVLTHDVSSDEPIPFAVLPVVEFFYRGQWRTPVGAITCREAIDQFLEQVSE